MLGQEQEQLVNTAPPELPELRLHKSDAFGKRLDFNAAIIPNSLAQII